MRYSHNADLKEPMKWKMKSIPLKDFLKDIISTRQRRGMQQSRGHIRFDIQSPPPKNYSRIKGTEN